MPPFVFISSSRGTLTATCRVCRSPASFFPLTRSPSHPFARHPASSIWKTLCGLPQFSGERRRRNERETRLEKVFSRCDGVLRRRRWEEREGRGRASHACCRTRCVCYDYVIISHPALLSFRDLYLLFTSVFLPQFSCILLSVEFYRAASKRRSFSSFNLRMSFSFV